MSSSQHLLVLISLILGFGIRELLVSGRAALVERPSGELHLLPFAVGLLVMVVIIQFWWYLFIVAGRQSWDDNFFLFALTLLRPALLFISAASVFPAPGNSTNLVDHYLQNRKFIALPLGLYEGLNLAESATNLGTVLHPAHVFHVAFIVISLCLAFARSQRVHQFIVAVIFLLTSIFIANYSLTIN